MDDEQCLLCGTTGGGYDEEADNTVGSYELRSGERGGICDLCLEHLQNPPKFTEPEWRRFRTIYEAGLKAQGYSLHTQMEDSERTEK